MGVTFTWRFSHLRGPASPRCGHVLLVLNSFGVGCVGLLSQKKKKKKKLPLIHLNVATLISTKISP